MIQAIIKKRKKGKGKKRRKGKDSGPSEFGTGQPVGWLVGYVVGDLVS